MSNAYVLPRLLDWISSKEPVLEPEVFALLLERLPDVPLTRETLPSWVQLLHAATVRVRGRLDIERHQRRLDGWHYELATTPLTVIGDVHGDVHSLLAILRREGVLTGERPALFLGDLIDRGQYDLHCLLIALLLKSYSDYSIYLLRGNHEIWTIEHGVPVPSNDLEGGQSFLHFWRDLLGAELCLELHHLFEALPAAAVLGQTLLAHAAIPRDAEAAGVWPLELANPEVRRDVAWGDPEDKPDVIQYGTRFKFARKQWAAFKARTGLKRLIRSHEATLRGFSVCFGDEVITIFSTGGETAAPDYRGILPHYAVMHSSGAWVKAVYGGSAPIACK